MFIETQHVATKAQKCNSYSTYSIIYLWMISMVEVAESRVKIWPVK